MAVATPTRFRFEVDEDERTSIYDERDQYHDEHISERFQQILNPNARLEDLFNNYNDNTVQNSAAPAPVQEQEAAPAQQAFSAPQQTMQAGPQLVQDARVTSDLFRVKDTYQEAAVAAPAVEEFDYATANFQVIGQSSTMEDSMAVAEEEENEDLVPTMTTRQYKNRAKLEEGQIENTGVAKKSSLMLSKRDKILMFSIIGIVAVLFVLIIVNAAIISGLNSQVSEVEQQYNAVYSEYTEVNNQIQDTFDYLDENMDQIAANLGMTK